MGTTRIVVHVGPMKTGTSAFAAGLWRAVEEGTLAPDIMYPAHELWFPANGEIVKHHDLVEIAPLISPTNFEAPRKTANTATFVDAKLVDIAAEARRRGGNVTVIMVCEIGDQLAEPSTLGARLAELFDRVDVVLVAREQTGAIPSLLGQQLRMWNRKKVTSLRISSFLRYHRERNAYDYDYLWDRWSFANAPYTLHVVPYRSSLAQSENLNQCIFDELGLGAFPQNQWNAGKARIHPTFSSVGMHLLVLGKKLDRVIGWFPAGSRLAQYVFDRFLGYCHAESRRNVETFTAWKLPRSERAKVVEAYRTSNETFRSKLGPLAHTPEWMAWFERALTR